MLSVYIILLSFALQDAALIKFVRFDGNTNYEFENNIVNSESLRLFNEELLGIRASKTNSNANLFDRPNALAIVDIKGVKRVKLPGKEIPFFGDAIGDPLEDPRKDDLEREKWRMITINSFGDIDGESKKLIDIMHETEIQEEKTGSERMNKQLVALHKLESALGKFEKENNTVQIYRISLEVPPSQSKTENETLSETKFESALANLINVLHNIYGDKLVVEFLTQIEAKVSHLPLNDEYLENLRITYQVQTMTHQDYPAIFLIVSTVVGIFIFALIAVVISFWDNQDMGKNSIIYRLTNNRRKKD